MASPTAASATQTSFRSDVQGMRAVAVGIVIVAHIATYQVASLSWLQGGFIGVDVFFVLSGYLITGLMLNESARTGGVSLVGFYARRARRILPAATVVLIAVVAYAAWRLPGVERTQYDHDATWSVVFLANWHFAQEGVSYFDTRTLSPLQHFWSLAVEEQFYIVWPVLLGTLLARGWRRSRLGILLVLLCLASLAWSVLDTAHRGPVAAHEAYFSSLTRAYEIGIGALIAIARPRIASRWWRTLLGAAGLAVIVAAVPLLGPDSPFPGWQALIPCLAAGALIVAGDGGTTIITALLSIRPLRFLGDISYSAYLWHFPVIVLASTLFPIGWSDHAIVPAELVVMLALATASYYLIERPFHRRRATGSRAVRRTLVLWPVAIALVLATVGAGSAYATWKQTERRDAALAWYRQHPPPGRGPTNVVLRMAPARRIRRELSDAVSLAGEGAPFPPDLDLGQMAEPQPGVGYMCYASDGQDKLSHSCVYGDKAASRTVALVGDSHAGMISPALDAMGRRDHFRVQMYQKLTCGPYYVQQRRGSLASECDRFRAWTWRRLRATRPSVVILYGRGYLFEVPGSGQTTASAWQAGEVAAVKRFTSLGAKVILMGDIPARDQQAAACIQEHSQESACIVAPTGPESQSNVVTEAVAEQRHVGYLPLQQFACVAGSCPLVVGSRIVYWDDSHFARTWIDHITPALEQRLTPLIYPHRAAG